MFGLGDRKQAKKNHGAAYHMAMIFTVVIEFALGTNAAFLMYQNFKITVYTMLSNETWATILTIILAFAFGAGIFLGGMWTFAGFIDNLDDARAYRKEFKTGKWPEVLIWSGLVLVVILDFTTLTFRYAFFGEKGALSLFAFSCVLIILPPVLGPLIHVLEHTPHKRQMAKVRVQAEQRHTALLSRVADEIDDDLLGDLLSDDEATSQAAVDEHYRRVDARAAEVQSQQDKEQKDAAEGEGRRNRPLSLASQRKQRAR